LSERPFKVWVGDPDAAEPTHRAEALIFATGAQSLMLGVDGENRLMGHGVSTCATCDGFFFRDQEIAVVGGGDSALEEATFLSRFGSKVTLIVRRDELRASKIMQDRAMANPKIEFLWNTSVTKVNGADKVESLSLINNKTDETSEMAVSGLFVAIGHKPNTAVIDGQLPQKENGYVMTVPGSTRTDIDGVFVCGDLQDDYYRQAITAAGSGCMAAIDAERWLEAQND
ncbi:MAG: FAD-dependent oxidoreductase, partial [Acidimicrobiales bacterium]|nr:FAD-dependent oxidoreductase [Acidimicrobiales bacterium]